LQVQTVSAAAVGVADAAQRCECRRHAESQLCPQGFNWHGDKHIEEAVSLIPSKL